MTMMVVNIHEAKAKLSEYLDAVAAGERVVDLQAEPAGGRAAGGRTEADRAAAHRRRDRHRRFPPSFFDPMPDDWLDEFYNGPIFPEAHEADRAWPRVAPTYGVADASPAPRSEAAARHLHVLVGADRRAARFRPRVAAYRSHPDNEVFLSAASAWEIAIKYARGQAALCPVIRHRFVPTSASARGVAALADRRRVGAPCVELPPLHRDPFDRLLVSQAIVHGMTILTPDPDHRALSGADDVVSRSP